MWKLKLLLVLICLERSVESSPPADDILWADGPYPEKIEKYIEGLDIYYVKEAKDLEYYRAKSRALFMLAKRIYEVKRGYIQLPILAGRIKKLNEEFITKFPREGIAYVGLAEYFHHLPIIFGGNPSKAEELYEKALTLNKDEEVLFKILLFELYTKTKEQIPISEAQKEICSNLFEKLDFQFTKKQKPYSGMTLYYQKWTLFERSVFLYFSNDPIGAAHQLRDYASLEPESYWAYYLAWKIGNDYPQLVESHLLPLCKDCFYKAFDLGKTRGDLSFLDLIESEYSQQRKKIKNQ